MTSNNLSKEQQKIKGQGTLQKGDWCEYIAAAHFRKEAGKTFDGISRPSNDTYREEYNRIFKNDE